MWNICCLGYINLWHKTSNKTSHTTPPLRAPFAKQRLLLEGFLEFGEDRTENTTLVFGGEDFEAFVAVKAT